jgi:BioD-like phosphotransacetylase family protein
VVTIFITSLSGGAGKTAVCAGLGKYLINQGKKVGYLSPAIGSFKNETDASFLKDIFVLPEPLDFICPTFESEDRLAANIKKLIDAISSGKEVVLVESGNANAAREAYAKVIPVITYTELINNKVVPACKSYGQELAGIILNKVPTSQLHDVWTDRVPSLKETGINVLGVLPEDRTLLTFNISELAEIVDGKILNADNQTEQLPAGFMLGAMTVDSGLPYFSRISDKVAIIRSERPDMMMAALHTSTMALVVTGDRPLIPQVQNLTEDKKVPVILTKYDCATVAGRIEEGLLKTRFNQKRKVDRLLELMSKAFDFQLLSNTTGI